VYLPWSKTNKRDPRYDELHCNVIKAFFAGKSISQVSPILVEKFKRERIKTKTIHDRARAPASVNRELAALSRILTMAVDNGLIASNPCRRVKKFREDNQRTRYLTVEEEENLLDQCIDRRAYLRPIILLAINTGMRRGEILSLKWSQVDFSRRLIYVTNTKTEKDRVIPMNETVVSALECLSRKDERLFRVTDFKKAFTRACDKAEITGLRFHDLRHTAATRLADGGADAFTIAAILGHSTIQMSARYTHATDERKRRAVEAIERLSDRAGHKSVTKRKLA
jgi:integrase